MALLPKLAKGAVDSDLEFFYLTDDTGVYNVTTNPTGYNTPNPARNTLALYVYGYKYIADGDDTPLVIANTIPLTVTQWTIPMPVDGYTYYRILAIPLWTSAPQVTGNIVYYNSTYYIATANSTNIDPLTNTGNVWSLVTDLTTDAVYANTSIYVNSFDLVTNYFGKRCLQTQMFLEASTNCECGPGDTNRAEVRPYQKIFSMLYVAGIFCAQQKYNQADDELVSLNEYCTSIDCPSC